MWTGGFECGSLVDNQIIWRMFLSNLYRQSLQACVVEQATPPLTRLYKAPLVPLHRQYIRPTHMHPVSFARACNTERKTNQMLLSTSKDRGDDEPNWLG